jgi:hypothetical protein
MRKDQPNYKVHINALGQKDDQPKDPLMGVSGRLNNKHIALRRVMITKKKKLWNIKGIDERYELIQLPTCNT